MGKFGLGSKNIKDSRTKREEERAKREKSDSVEKTVEIGVRDDEDRGGGEEEDVEEGEEEKGEAGEVTEKMQRLALTLPLLNLPCLTSSRVKSLTLQLQLPPK